MAFPSVLGRNTVQSSANGTATNDPIPSFSRGDLLLAFLAIDGATAPTWGAGFAGWNTFVGLVTIGNSACQLALVYRVADGSEGNLALDLGASENWCSEIVVVDAGTFDENTPPAFGTAVSGSGADPNPPSLNPADWGTEDTLWIAASAGDADVAYTAAPSGYSNSSFLKSTDGTAGNRVALGYAELQSAAASEDPGVFTRSAEDSSAQTYGLRPFTAAHAQPIAYAKSFYSTGTATVDVTITVVAGYNRRLMVAAALELSGASISSVTLDPAGLNKSLVRCTDGTTTATQNQDSVAYCSWWSLLETDIDDFTVGNTYTLRVVASTSTEVAVTALMVTDTDQTSNVASVANNGTTSGTSTTAAVTVSFANSLVLSLCYKNNAATPLTSMTAAGLNMMPRGSCVLPTNGAHFVVAAKGLTTESGSQNVVETVPGAVRLSLTAVVLRPAYRLVAGAGSYGLTGNAAGLAHGYRLTAAVGTYALTGHDATLTASGGGGAFTLTANPATFTLTGAAAALIRGRVLKTQGIYGVGIGSSTLKGTVGSPAPTTPWRTHFSNYLAALRPGSSFGHLAENGYSTYELLPLAYDGTASRPAVDPARNIDAAIAQRPHFIIVNVNSDIQAAVTSWGYSYGTLTAAIDDEIWPNYLIIADAARQAGIPIYFTNGQPTDINTGGNDAAYQAALMYLRNLIDANLNVIDFWSVLVAGGGDNSANNSLISDDRHPNDTATPLLSDAAEAVVSTALAGGAYHLGAWSIDIDADRRIVAAPGVYNLTGNGTGVAAGRKLTCSAGSYALTGNDAGLKAGRSVVAAVATYVLTGNVTALLAAHRLACATGAYALTGHDAGLVTDDALLVAEAANFVLSGGAAGIAAQRRLVAALGSYVLTGNSAGVAHGYSLTAALGSYALTGNPAGFAITRALAAATTSYVLTGHAATIDAGRQLPDVAPSFLASGAWTKVRGPTFTPGYDWTKG
jgi:hypothetical protein